MMEQSVLRDQPLTALVGNVVMSGVHHLEVVGRGWYSFSFCGMRFRHRRRVLRCALPRL